MEQAWRICLHNSGGPICTPAEGGWSGRTQELCQVTETFLGEEQSWRGWQEAHERANQIGHWRWSQVSGGQSLGRLSFLGRMIIQIMWRCMKAPTNDQINQIEFEKSEIPHISGEISSPRRLFQLKASILAKQPKTVYKLSATPGLTTGYGSVHMVSAHPLKPSLVA